jgi:FixJ family two-component response regulator
MKSTTVYQLDLLQVTHPAEIDHTLADSLDMDAPTKAKAHRGQVMQKMKANSLAEPG